MPETLTILIKFLLCSGLLTGFYFLMFRNKSSFLSARIFLLAIPVVSLLLSVVTIPVPESWLFGSSAAEPIVSEAIIPTPQAPTPEFQAVSSAVTSEAPRQKHPLFWVFVVLSGYIAVVMAYQASLIRQFRKIVRVRAGATKHELDDCTIYRSGEITNPFSIMKGIYISSECTEDKYSVIIAHERQHIRHRHYLDMVLIEIMTVVFWFNPVIWLIRRELRTTHEFQADESILRSGIDQRFYMLTILEETAGSIPAMANGFNNSLIKKRFLKMKNGNHIKHRIARAGLSTALMASLLLVFSCRATKTAHTAVDPAGHKNRLEQMDWSDHRTVNLTYSEADGKYYTPDGNERCWCENCQAKAKKFKTKYLSHNDVKIVTGYNHSAEPSRLVRIEADRHETRVTFVVEIYWDSNWLHRSSMTCLIDPKTGDRYMIRNIAGGAEVGRMNVVEGLKGQFVELTCIFPPLKRGVEVIHFYEPDGFDELPDNGTNGGGVRIKNIKIADWTTDGGGKIIL